MRRLAYIAGVLVSGSILAAIIILGSYPLFFGSLPDFPR